MAKAADKAKSKSKPKREPQPKAVREPKAAGGEHPLLGHLSSKSALGENVDRASREPMRFYLPPYIGPRGWFGLRLDGEAVDWSEVKNLVELSYGLVAPKRLLAKT